MNKRLEKLAKNKNKVEQEIIPHRRQISGEFWVVQLTTHEGKKKRKSSNSL